MIFGFTDARTSGLVRVIIVFTTRGSASILTPTELIIVLGFFYPIRELGLLLFYLIPITSEKTCVRPLFNGSFFPILT